jgi:hypothetical protein
MKEKRKSMKAKQGFIYLLQARKYWGFADSFRFRFIPYKEHPQEFAPRGGPY